MVDKVTCQYYAVIITAAISVIFEFWIHLIQHIDTVFTHVFYIPIVLCAMWFGYRAIPIAVGLGALHVSVAIAIGDAANTDPYIRAVLLVVIGALIAYFHNWNQTMQSDIDDLKERSDDTLSTLRELTAALKPSD